VAQKYIAANVGAQSTNISYNSSKCVNINLAISNI